jgi:hypothetical protein
MACSRAAAVRRAAVIKSMAGSSRAQQQGGSTAERSSSTVGCGDQEHGRQQSSRSSNTADCGDHEHGRQQSSRRPAAEQSAPAAGRSSRSEQQGASRVHEPRVRSQHLGSLLTIVVQQLVSFGDVAERDEHDNRRALAADIDNALSRHQVRSDAAVVDLRKRSYMTPKASTVYCLRDLKN